VTGALNWYRAATFAVPGGTCDIRLPDGSVPTTLLWGANDTALLVSLAERHRATLPWLVVDIHPEANHWIPRTHPDVIAHVLLPH
jgi:pimeloyl-ACP methyl ester carboxylesterase